ncbi:histidine phosphatase family protein [Paenibacillus melissococcoides]|uniref:Histidine phosphatase family protein n=1 Tax=Paenibacillus melissococcoides TaxID=2912268 RepID=A0ABM9G4J5_9BACL|nr:MULTISPECIES: histidine phosphatase family protein [Paenibacillus]MEB9897810.1 histidine phosphatase family protein [Bacillus cereus]CAH8246669.1 histidine phosphatase family protein [Paenibacillus melissococcoides]CAH8715396.1 histidine phosphatase family protein [Paenibacillus melissococcoides]CAH8716359.1 histidine phosphatase family protein [Paenibacillus melissococcoides]GIO80044.1 phosphatase [Paenibacillus dendritiformis]
MAKTTLYLTRHGQTEWNVEERMQGHKDSPLTSLGVLQAEWLQQRLEPVRLDAVYSSSSLRAWRTARIAAGHKQVSIRPMDEFMEINLGLWEGQHIEFIENQFGQQYLHFFNRPDLYQPTGCGETYEQLISRVIPAIDSIISRHQGETVLIVTHRITLKTIMGYYGNKTLHELGSLPDIQSASLSKISIENRVPTIEMYGDTSHYQ